MSKAVNSIQGYHPSNAIISKILDKIDLQVSVSAAPPEGHYLEPSDIGQESEEADQRLYAYISSEDSYVQQRGFLQAVVGSNSTTTTHTTQVPGISEGSFKPEFIPESNLELLLSRETDKVVRSELINFHFSEEIDGILAYISRSKRATEGHSFEVKKIFDRYLKLMVGKDNQPLIDELTEDFCNFMEAQDNHSYATHWGEIQYYPETKEISLLNDSPKINIESGKVYVSGEGYKQE
ncbi:MAG TPA: hypothetical protein VGO50_19840 [Pyrinomonadaceae bacterium]|jgi:hypothetical protein|nr:hypothetical protein [Pyrinomonadaceae bacterium]